MKSDSIPIGGEKAIMPERIPPALSKPLARYLELELLLHIFFESTGYCKENYGRTCNGCCNEKSLNIQKSSPVAANWMK